MIKELFNMLGLIVLTKSRYTSLFLFILIKSENNLEDFSHFFDLNKAKKEAMDSLRKLRKLSFDLEPITISKTKIIKEKILVEEFLSMKEWEGLKILEPKCGISIFLKKMIKKNLIIYRKIWKKSSQI